MILARPAHRFAWQWEAKAASERNKTISTWILGWDLIEVKATNCHSRPQNETHRCSRSLAKYLESVGHVPHPLPVVVCMSYNYDAVTPSEQALAEGPDVHLHAAEPGIKEVAHHTDSIPVLQPTGKQNRK